MRKKYAFPNTTYQKEKRIKKLRIKRQKKPFFLIDHQK